MKRIVCIVLAVAVVLLQMSLLPALRPFGVVPNLMLVFVVLMGLEGTASSALVVALAGGLALDFASGADFGLWTGVLTLAALLTGMVHRAGLELKSIWPAVALVVAGTIVMAVILLLGLVNAVGVWPVGGLAVRVVTEVIINLLLMLAVRPLVRWAASGLQAGVMPIG